MRSPSNNKLVAAGLLGFIALSASFPFVFARTGPTVSEQQKLSVSSYTNSACFVSASTCAYQVDSSKPLSGQAAVRGAYINSGSKDIGPDPTRYDGSKGTAVYAAWRQNSP